MKFTKDRAMTRGWDGLDFWVYNTKEQFTNASAAYFEVTGKHGKVKTTKSDRIYYVVEGEGVFEIDGVQETVSATDVIIVPKNTAYDYWATSKLLKLFLVHTPAFDPTAEVQVDA